MSLYPNWEASSFAAQGNSWSLYTLCKSFVEEKCIIRFKIDLEIAHRGHLIKIKQPYQCKSELQVVRVIGMFI